MTEAQSAFEELKMFLEVESLDLIKKKLNKFYMVIVLYSVNPDFEHVRDQLLIVPPWKA